MAIHGFQKLTLLDYPEKVACTIFLGQCNFRCPFCHNANLVLVSDQEAVICEDEILDALKKRKGILEGVCITGGEPTLYPELGQLMKKIKALNYQVKLDTNGYRPKVLKQLVQDGLVDYVAMDIKNSPSQYAKTAAVEYFRLELIQESVDFLMNGSLDYEFRTTIAKELHSKNEVIEIGKWLKGCKRYYLQPYRESTSVIQPVFSAYTKVEMEQWQKMLMKYISVVGIRGMN